MTDLLGGPLFLQDAWLLLQSCEALRANYLLCILPPHLAAAYSAAHAALLVCHIKASTLPNSRSGSGSWPPHCYFRLLRRTLGLAVRYPSFTPVPRLRLPKCLAPRKASESSCRPCADASASASSRLPVCTGSAASRHPWPSKLR